MIDSLQTTQLIAEASVGNLLLGNTAWQIYIAAIIFSLIGAFINTMLQGFKGVKNNPNSPNEFSWKYLLKDSYLKILSSIFANLIIIRFQSYVIPDEYQNIVSVDFILLVCLINGALGYGIDFLFSIIKSKTTFFDTKRN